MNEKISCSRGATPRMVVPAPSMMGLDRETAAWTTEFLAKPLDERLAFAEQARAQSQAHTAEKAMDIMDVSAASVGALMAHLGVKDLIHGHTHRPARHDSAGGTRWVLGDWDQQGWAIELVDKSPNLYSFDIN